jgi:bacteriorhodopsin
MNCADARRVVVLPLADAEELASARHHILECPLCASATDSAEDAIIDRADFLRKPGGARRAMIFFVGSLQAIIALPWIFGATPFWNPQPDTAIAHLTRDGVIGVVLGLVGIAVAISPRLAYFALSVCGLLLTLQLVGFIADRSNNRVLPMFETVHVLSVLITILVVFTAFPPKRS